MRNRRAFTLIELLVVISIILLLVGMVLMVIRPIQESVRKSKTLGMMQIIQQSLGVLSAQRGGMIAPAEHPLAASKEPRRPFARSASGHAAVSVTGDALQGVLPGDISSGQDRLLLPDDRLIDPALTTCFGMERRRLGVLGSPMTAVTSYRQVKQKATPVDPNDDRQVRVVAPVGGPSEQEAFLQSILQGTGWTELLKMGCIKKPDDDDAANLIESGRLWSSTGPADEYPSFRGPSGTITYLQRGPAFYDAWGREILYATTANGFTLESPGRDGSFVWNPGKDTIFQTDAWATAPSGDDRDAHADNVQAGSGP